MAYKDWFDRGRDYQVRLYHYCVKPSELDTPERIAYQDKTAAQFIKEAQEVIESLQEYRRDLAARYAQLDTMPYKLRLELERKPEWNGHKTYHVRIIKAYEDGTETPILQELYKGTERRQAIARFKELKKARPGIEAKLDIEKRSWER